ncbi:MAG: FHA domain-containing protein, partial [Ktedonobacterales bacterium]
MANVEIQTPDGVVQVRLDRDHLTIGRLANNAIALPYPHISRQHAELRQMGQTWWIVDLRSTNGLHVAGQRVSECQLTPETFVMLSPLVTLRLIEERTAAFPSSGGQASHYAPGYAPGYGAPSQVPAPPPSRPSIAPSAGPISVNEPVRPLSALGSRSPYADDEAPFYPQMRQPAGPYYPG